MPPRRKGSAQRRRTPTPRRQSVAPASVVRVTEVSGVSPRNWDAAITAAVKSADVRDPIGVEVSRMWAEWSRGRLGRYHVTVRVAYRQQLKAAKT